MEERTGIPSVLIFSYREKSLYCFSMYIIISLTTCPSSMLPCLMLLFGLENVKIIHNNFYATMINYLNSEKTFIHIFIFLSNFRHFLNGSLKL